MCDGDKQVIKTHEIINMAYKYYKQINLHSEISVMTLLGISFNLCSFAFKNDLWYNVPMVVI